jgi:hypothetical protein
VTCAFFARKAGEDVIAGKLVRSLFGGCGHGFAALVELRCGSLGFLLLRLAE